MKYIAPIVVLGIISVIGYLLYLYAAEFWFLILFYSYFLLVALFLIGYIIMFKKLKSNQQFHEKVSSIINREKKYYRIRKVRYVFLGILQFISESVVLPVIIIYGAVIRKDVNEGSESQVMSKMTELVKAHWISAYTLSIILLAFLLLQFGINDHGHGHIFLYFIAIGLLSKHLYYLLNFTSLPERLRRYSKRPFSISRQISISPFAMFHRGRAYLT